MSCGTDAGYTVHRKRGEPACPDCKAAHARAQQHRRRGRPRKADEQPNWYANTWPHPSWKP